MANVGQALYAHLCANPVVAALAGNRGYPRLVPQTTSLPAWAYQMISNPGEHTQEGKAGVRRALYQITCVGETYAQAQALAGAIDQALDGFRGLLGGTLRASSFVENMLDRSELTADMLENAAQVDVAIWYEE